MKPRAASTALCLGLLAATVPAAAQDPQPLGPGVRVRISVAASKERLKGTVQALEPSVLAVISDDHQLVRVPRSTITRLETGWGRRGNARKGLLIGGAVGVTGGLLACGLSDDDWPFEDEDFGEACDGGDWVAVPLLAGAVYGGIGALIGHFIKTDRWVEVPLDRVKVSLGPAPAGLGLALSIRF
jgi:hypothetical protein